MRCCILFSMALSFPQAKLEEGFSGLAVVKVLTKRRMACLLNIELLNESGTHTSYIHTRLNQLCALFFVG
jgi:hypothetical protein